MTRRKPGGSHGGRRRSPEEVLKLREARAARKEDCTLEDVGFGGVLRYEFSDCAVEVSEDWHSEKDGIAALQWAGGVRLARFFDSKRFEPGFWVGKRVLELGAGCGLTSCVLAAKGAKVDCTDAEPSFASATVEGNASTAAVHRYVWSSEPFSLVPYDVVVAGDCLYHETHATDLCFALEANGDDDTDVYVCGAVSPEAHRAFVGLATDRFDVDLLLTGGDWAPGVVDWDERSLLRLRKKKKKHPRPPPLTPLTPLSRPPLSAVAPATKENALDAAAAEGRFHGCLEDDDDDAYVAALSPTTTRRITVSDDDLNNNIGVVADGGALVLDGILSQGECARLVEKVLASPELSFWSTTEDRFARRFRDARTLEARLPSLATRLWHRIEGLVVPWLQKRHGLQEDGTIERKDDALLDPTDDQDDDRWRIAGLNDDFLFATYPAGGAFAPHTDGVTRKTLNRRSLFSIIIYLNDCSDGGGGETRFYDADVVDRAVLDASEDRWTAKHDEPHRGDVRPAPGRLLLFDQALVHEGRPPKGPKGQKHIIRSDLLFERERPIFDGPNDRAAFDAYERACHDAGDGRHGDAVRLFERCRKLSPKLASRLLGA